MSTTSTKKSRRPLVYALLIIFLWFGASGAFFPLFTQLSTVQENDNSAFLPDSAESTQAAKVIEKFNQDQIQNLPTLVLYLGEVDESKIAALNAHLAKLGETKIIGTDVPMSKYLAQGEQIFAFPSEDGKALLVNLPLKSEVGSELLPNKKRVLPEVIETLREDSTKFAKSVGLVSNVTGIGALQGDLSGVFEGIDSLLLL